MKSAAAEVLAAEDARLGQFEFPTVLTELPNEEENPNSVAQWDTEFDKLLRTEFGRSRAGRQRRVKLPKAPNGQHLSYCRLYLQVVARDGFEAVTAKGSWTSIATNMGLGHTAAALAPKLQELYEQFLLPLEDAVFDFRGNTGPLVAEPLDSSDVPQIASKFAEHFDRLPPRLGYDEDHAGWAPWVTGREDSSEDGGPHGAGPLSPRGGAAAGPSSGAGNQHAHSPGRGQPGAAAGAAGNGATRPVGPYGGKRPRAEWQQQQRWAAGEAEGHGGEPPDGGSPDGPDERERGAGGGKRLHPAQQQGRTQLASSNGVALPEDFGVMLQQRRQGSGQEEGAAGEYEQTAAAAGTGGRGEGQRDSVQSWFQRRAQGSGPGHGPLENGCAAPLPPEGPPHLGQPAHTRQQQQQQVRHKPGQADYHSSASPQPSPQHGNAAPSRPHPVPPARHATSSTHMQQPGSHHPQQQQHMHPPVGSPPAWGKERDRAASTQSAGRPQQQQPAREREDAFGTAKCDSIVPNMPAMVALRSPRVECICKVVFYDPALDNAKQIALLVNKSGLYGFQPGEGLRATYTEGGKGVILAGTNQAKRYMLFAHSRLPRIEIKLETVLNGGTEGGQRTPLPEETWEAVVDCSDVLAEDEVLDDSLPMRRAYSVSNSGCMLLLFGTRQETSDLEIDDF